MNKFSWYEANSVEDALKQVNATVSEAIQSNGSGDAAVFKAGGVDLLDLMKEGLVNPQKIINIRNIFNLDKITYDKKSGLRLGANITLSEIEKDITIKGTYLALHQAAARVGTPQIRNMSTLGGNIAQRTRCWYFRSIHHDCLRKGSGTCFARTGENGYHAIMKNGSCTSVHASSVSTALIAFNASVEITNSKGETKMVNMKDFFVLPGDDSRRENILKANELITAIVVPAPSSKTKSYYIKQGERESNDWALADVAVVAELSGLNCKSARIVLGAAAPVPWLSQIASDALTGNEINENSAKQAAEASMDSATPLEKNAYKVPMFKAIVKRAILELV
jgi:xanthine dehydrogenase YagS FAD-binding subunit